MTMAAVLGDAVCLAQCGMLRASPDDLMPLDDIARALGCAFHFAFWFLIGHIFRNPRNSVDYFRFRTTHVGIK